MKQHERTYLQRLEAIRTNSIIHSKSSTYSPPTYTDDKTVWQEMKFVCQMTYDAARRKSKTTG